MQWEYHSELGLDHSIVGVDRLNELGALGWELIDYEHEQRTDADIDGHTGRMVRWIFKRELKRGAKL